MSWLLRECGEAAGEEPLPRLSSARRGGLAWTICEWVWGALGGPLDEFGEFLLV